MLVSDKNYCKRTLYFKENEFIEQIQIYFVKEILNLDYYRKQIESQKNLNFLELEIANEIIGINFSTNLKAEKNILHNENQMINKEYIKQNSQKLKINKQENFINEFSLTIKTDILKNLNQLNKNSNNKNKNKNESSITVKNLAFTYCYNSKKRDFTKSSATTTTNNSKNQSQKDLDNPSPTNKPLARERASSIFNSNSMLTSLKNYQRRKSRDFSKSFKNVFKLFNCLGYIIKLLTLLLLSIIGFCIYYYFSQNILKGLVILHKNNLKFPTKLYTDAHGIIHIRAANFEDAFFTLGYAQARDRLWQIDFLRKFAKGKLSHLLGAKALKIDKYMRNLGISFRAKHDLKTFSSIKEENFFSGNFHFEGESQKEIEIFKQVEKFVDGINYYVKNNFLPLEYYILNVKFKKFSVLDCFAISRLMSFLLTFDWHVEIFNHVLEITQGKDFMQKFDLWNFRNFPFANESVISHEDVAKMNLNFKNFDVERIVNFRSYKDVIDKAGNIEANETLVFNSNKTEIQFREKNEPILFEEKEEIKLNKNQSSEENETQKNLSSREIEIIKKALASEKQNLLESIKLKEKDKNKNTEDSIDINMQISHASNSWVVHGNLTKSGKPIFTNDPHLTNRLPSLHYLVKLYVGKPEEDIENVIVGSTFPGIPIVLFGNNKNISWGFTTDNRDTMDIIEEFVTPDYKYFIDSEGNVAKTFSRKEKIKIKDELKQYYKIYYTENGVLLDEYLKETSAFGIYYKHAQNVSKFDLSDMEKLEKLLGKENINSLSNNSDNNNTYNNHLNDVDYVKESTFKFNFTEFKIKANQINEIKINNQTFIRALSLRFPTFDMEIGALKFYFDLMKAKRKEDFMDSLAEFTAPVLAFSWATTENEIGYTSIGKIPVKKFKESKIILKEAMNKNPQNFEIEKFISRNETPVLINPQKGFIVTANNEANPWNYNNYVQSYAYFNRFHRINELLEAKLQNEEFKFEVKDSIEMLSDVHDSYAEIVLPKLLKILEKNFGVLDKEIKELKEYLVLAEREREVKTLNENANAEANLQEQQQSNLNSINLKHKELIAKFEIDLKLVEEYEAKLDLINSILAKLKGFDFKFHKESEAASIYSIFEYLLGRNLLLKGERTLEAFISEYKRIHGFIDENFDAFIPGFESESEANGLLNNMNIWNFIVNLITEISDGNKIELENCNYYNYLKDFKSDFFKSYFYASNENQIASACESYIVSTLIYFLDYIKEKDYLDKQNKFILWGELHYNNYPHEPFENVEFLRLLFSRRSSTGGTRNTIKVSKNKFHDPKSPFASTHSANLKYICDLADITQPYVLIDTGNSGNILSKFYDNFIEKSEKNEFVKVLDHNFNDDYHLLISFPEDNTLILKNPS